MIGYANETNGLNGSNYHEAVDHSRRYTLAELQAAGGKVSRLRLLTEAGYPWYDISYAHGTLPDGTIVPLHVTTMKLRRKALKADLIAWAKEEGVYAKGLGLLDAANWSTMW